MVGIKQEISNVSESSYSDYIEGFDSTTGKVTLKPNPLEINGKQLEHFTAFSISAGHEATDIKENQKVTISFLPYVHLVKLDAFYVNEYMTVVGSGTDSTVFGTTEQADKEQDAVWVYTYIKEEGDHKVGDIVKKEENGTQKPVYKGEQLPDGLQEGVDVQLTKVYSTLKGLHTDKTVNKIDGNDRKFSIDLESWFSGAKAADIGLVLDASGSMVFTSDALKPININDEDLGLTDEQKEKLMKKALSKKKCEDEIKTEGTTESEAEGPSINTWKHDIFLTQEEVNEILSTDNTDNNPLSGSGYNYYVFNEAEDVNEYAPLGYWDGSLDDDLYDSLIGYYEFNKGDYDNTKDNNRRDWIKNSVNGKEASLVKQIDSDALKESDSLKFETVDTPSDWAGDDRIKMKADKGLTVKDLNKENSNIEGLGVLLDVKPTSNSFTISFTVEKSSGTDGNCENETDLLYIGPLDKFESSDYYRVCRANNSSKNRLKVKDNNSHDDVSINNVFNKTELHTVTLVFNNGEITSYLDGKKTNDAKSPDNSINLTDRNIVITGFDNDCDSADLYIDNVCVFDKALSEAKVEKISFPANELKEKEYLAYNTYDGEEKEEKIGYTNKYFVDPVTGGMNGWYYINHDSNLTAHYFMDKIETAKVLWGVNNESTEEVKYTDEIKIPTGVESNHEDTGYTFEPDGDSPTLFYLDENGNLCCFFTRGTKQDTAGTSLVYKKDDSDYIKAEALQRAIGSFATELSETSPYSEVSAVRYSANEVEKEQYDKFVLLDWTSDPSNIQEMMSLKYGDGGTLKGTDSSPESKDDAPITQYNYGITGGTATYVGLEAFKEKLSNGANPDADKYLVIFTDGKDTTPDENKEEITQTVEALKNQGYTIMAVMLTGGSIEYSTADDSEYQQAKKFLLDLVGTKDTSESDNKDEYFFSTAEVGQLVDGKKTENGKSNIDILTEIFTNELLERISDNLNSYSVQDYIDPRFNLVSATGREYKLDANGIVTILNTDGSTYAQYDLKNGLAKTEGVESTLVKENTDGKSYLSVTVSTDIDVDAREARLYFDNEKNMYYIKWVEQTIPGCVPEAKKLSVWNTRITVKAKDDFIGGNAVLTNGNAEKMNYVYSESDGDASSGVDDSLVEEDIDDTPSKGFPRVTVNIPTPNKEEKASETIYMGESISYNEIRQKMIDQLKQSTEEQLLLNYLEYLDRYEKNNNHAESYVEKLINGETITLPYSYLPNGDESNLTGGDKHKEDVLGELEYKMEVNNSKDGIINDREERTLTFTIVYKPDDEGQRLNKINTLVVDSDYGWDEKYKPAVGDTQIEKAVRTSEYKVDIVSGEVALQVVFDSKMVEILEDQNISYEVDLNKDGEKIGTFKATINNDELQAKKDDGSLVLTAKLEYADGYKEYMETNGLPLGNYTLGQQRITNEDAPSYIKFEQTNVVTDETRYVSDLFKVGTDYNDPTNFLATFKDENTIILGNKENEDTSYLQKRFGLFEVKPIAVFEMPEAGSNSLVILYIAIAVCIIISITLKYSAKLKIRRGKH